jgi:tryptophan synthase alpha subunit
MSVPEMTVIKSPGADSFIVGSAIVRIIEEYEGDPGMRLQKLKEFSFALTGL